MRVEGAPPCLVGTLCALRTLFSYRTSILVGKNSLYNLPGVLTPVSRKNLLSLFRAIFCQGCQGQALCHLPPPPTTGNDAWVMKIELKREEPGEINKNDGIKKATGDQVLAVEEEDVLQPHHNLFTPTEIEAFKMIELARIQNKYLTSENILLKEHIFALKGIIRKLEDLLRSMCDYPSPPSSPTKDIL